MTKTKRRQRFVESDAGKQNVTLRLDADLVARIDEAAEKDSRTRNSMCAVVLAEKFPEISGDLTDRPT